MSVRLVVLLTVLAGFGGTHVAGPGGCRVFRNSAAAFPQLGRRAGVFRPGDRLRACLRVDEQRCARTRIDSVAFHTHHRGRGIVRTVALSGGARASQDGPPPGCGLTRAAKRHPLVGPLWGPCGEFETRSVSTFEGFGGRDTVLVHRESGSVAGSLNGQASRPTCSLRGARRPPYKGKVIYPRNNCACRISFVISASRLLRSPGESVDRNSSSRCSASGTTSS